MVDWDDCMCIVKWIDVVFGEDFFIGVRKFFWFFKKKVIEVEVEFLYIVLENSIKDVELLFIVVCDFVKYRCKVENIYFKDILMF